MKVFDKLPPASPRHGFLRTVSAWKDAALLEFGPEGTMHYAQSSIQGETRNLFTTGMEERHVIFGDTSALEQAIRDLDRNLHPGILFVTSSPVSEIIGSDMAQICWDLQDEVAAVLCPWDHVPVEGHQADGRRKAFAFAADYLSTLAAAPKKQGFLVLGLDRSDWNGRSDLNELRRMMADYFHVPCLNDSQGQYRLADLASADFLITADADAQVLADAAAARWGTRSFPGLVYGAAASEQLVRAVSGYLGLAPEQQWEEDLADARLARDEFFYAIRPQQKCPIRICLSDQRNQALSDFLTEELGLQTELFSEDDHLKQPPMHAIIIGSDILCRLYPENPSLCMAYPTIEQRNFSVHIPFLGIRGGQNLMTALYPKVTGTGGAFF